MIKSNSYLNFDSIFEEFSNNLNNNPKLVKKYKKIAKKKKENIEDFFKVLPSLSDIKYKEIGLEYLNNNELDELIAIQSLLRVPSIKKLIKNVEMEIIPDIEIEISRLLEYTFNNNTFDNFESSINIENIIEYAEENYSINKQGFFFDNYLTEESRIYEYYANQLAIRYNHYNLMINFYEEELEWRNLIIQELKDYDIHFLDLIAYIYKTSDYEIFSLTKKRRYYQCTHLLNYKNNTFDFYLNGDYDEIEENTNETEVINLLRIKKNAPVLYSSNIPKLYINFDMNTPLNDLKEQLEDIYHSFQNKEIKIPINRNFYGGEKPNITEEVLDNNSFRKNYVLLFYFYDCYKILKNLDLHFSDEKIFKLIDKKVLEIKEAKYFKFEDEHLSSKTYKNYKSMMIKLIDNQGFKTLLILGKKN